MMIRKSKSALEFELKLKAEKHFDRWANNYDHGQLTNWLRHFQQRVINVMIPEPDNRILDVGCGTGWAVTRLGQMLARGRACGIDLSSAMITRARLNATDLPNVKFEQGDAENIPYENEQFDVVMCTNSFHHYPNPVKALREFRRVLKDGGAVYILDTCRDSSLLVVLYDLGHKVLVGDHVRYYHTNEIRNYVDQAGFSNIHEEFRVQKLFYKKKFLTSITLISAKKIT